MSVGHMIAIHGGAGTILEEKLDAGQRDEYHAVLKKSLEVGYSCLDGGGSSVEAVSASISVLEDSILFNAGRGSVFNSKGLIEMDASIMNGKGLRAGAVTCLKNVKNPIYAAKAVMEKCDHVLLCAEGAQGFSKENKLDFEPDEYFFSPKRWDQLVSARQKGQVTLDHSESIGTVGAVALDSKGDLAAGTSTGGLTNRVWGRCSDSSLIGSGNYANNKTCAVSCTGTGDTFIRGVSAYDLSALIEYKNLSLDESSKIVLEKLRDAGGNGGLISISAKGEVVLNFISKGMYRGYKKDKENCHLGIFSEMVEVK
ncbi:MAG: isoaspartyl peptidase/L-asparaginase [Bdellovibrionota bacterium]|nr:isoaspartyl peptidase/L-asparaginase [Bdellovibrionota bacterium]